MAVQGLGQRACHMLLAALLLANVATAFYIPGAAQVTHKRDKIISPFASSLTSIDGIISFPFYDVKFCQPEDTEVYAGDNLGMILRGERFEASPYLFPVGKNTTCEVVQCSGRANQLTRADLKKFKERIEAGYRANMVLDNLPLLTTAGAFGRPHCTKDSTRRRVSDIKGFSLGRCEEDPPSTQIFNHLDFDVYYNDKLPHDSTKTGEIYIVGFKVTPNSYAKDCSPDGGPVTTTPPAAGIQTKPVTWTYSVTWRYAPDTMWVTRWDDYLNSSEADTSNRRHWGKILQSVTMLLGLGILVAGVFVRILRRDFQRYNMEPDADDIRDEYGWKLLEADVFRPPVRKQLFASLIGFGSQLIAMTVSTLFVALLGFLSPSWRGAFLTTLVVLFVCTGLLNGSIMGLLQLMFKARQWKTVILAAVVYPGVPFALWAITEGMLGFRGSSGAVPLQTVAFMALLWLGLFVPLVVLGASYAYRQRPIVAPREYNIMGRQIPPQHWLYSTPAMLFLPSVFAYGAAHYELSLILQALWQGQVYYVFGFLAVVFTIVMLTISVTSIIYTYQLLVNEDHRWWWSSFLVPSGVGVYFFANAAFYYSTVLNVDSSLGTWIYFSYSFIVAVAISFMSGTVGFFAAFCFVRVIYTCIKLD
ncbi:Transmembrane 9 superfamily member 7 [Diplonema papillatum]|nr:Transmembrane 9 superfamily member 7 [Diplonema papillatum]